MMNILKVKIDNLTKKEILEKIQGFLDEPKFHQIATINPEFVLEAQKNLGFRNILNDCALNVADGVGIWFAHLRFGKILKARIAGADLILKILEIANQKKMSVFLACKKEGLSNFQETRDAILKIYPDLDISGNDIDAKNASYQIPNTKYQILLCNFGAPDQEIFINSLKCDTPPHLFEKDGKKTLNSNLQNDKCGGRIRLAMGVGGGFDFLTKKIVRAPYFMRLIGLEWLWRLFQPQEWKFKKERIKRIWKAIIIFPIKVILN